MAKCILNLSVRCQKSLLGNQYLAVVGDCEEMGEWQLKDAKKLNHIDDMYKISIAVPCGLTINYRYLVLLESPDSEEPLVQSWEAQTKPRSVSIEQSSADSQDKDDGMYNAVFSGQKVKPGWLTHQREVRIYISSPAERPFLTSLQNNIDLSNSLLKISVNPAPLSAKVMCVTPCKCETLQEVKDFKISDLSSGQLHLTLCIQTTASSYFSVFFKFYTEGSSEMIGMSTISDIQMKSKGTLSVPVFDSNGVAVAVLSVPYLLAKPMNDLNLTVNDCCTTWERKTMLNCGHRGSGNSFTSKKIANLRENSIASFLQASASNAGMVEFDVHLTKDLVPIVYHDMTTCLVVKKDNGDEGLLEIPVQDMTYKQITESRIKHRSRLTSTRELIVNEDDVSDVDNLPFPTLQNMFEKIPLSTGFNIEMKWPALAASLKFEDNLENYIDANVFVDKILDVVFKFAGRRKIAFSSFDVDICILTRRKQNKYPVLFLTNGDTKHYQPMLDIRERSNNMAIGTCIAEDLHGLDTLENDVYATPDIVEKTHNAGLIFACYGDNVGDNLPLMRKLGVDIAIYDRIYEE